MAGCGSGGSGAGSYSASGSSAGYKGSNSKGSNPSSYTSRGSPGTGSYAGISNQPYLQNYAQGPYQGRTLEINVAELAKDPFRYSGRPLTSPVYLNEQKTHVGRNNPLDAPRIYLNRTKEYDRLRVRGTLGNKLDGRNSLDNLVYPSKYPAKDEEKKFCIKCGAPSAGPLCIECMNNTRPIFYKH